jgi:tellurium resistance protein TerZ
MSPMSLCVTKIKKMALNLKKGDHLNLVKKDGRRLERLCIGINWGVIVEKSFFGLFTDKKSVDLDASVAVFDEKNILLDLIYFGKKKRLVHGRPLIISDDNAIIHSGDDLTGDKNGNDGLDNEIITIDLTKINPNATQIVFILNSYKQQDFETIPYSHIRIFEGTPQRPENVLATFNVSSEPQFVDKVTMLMGRLRVENGTWRFEAMGEPTRDRHIDDTVRTVQKYFL